MTARPTRRHRSSPPSATRSPSSISATPAPPSPPAARSRAIAPPRGRYVSLLDADDVWLPDKLARQLELLEAEPRVGLVHGDMEVIDAAGSVTRPSKHDWYGELPG